MAIQKDQQHPLWATDRAIVDSLVSGEPTDYNLAEVARLKMRYQGFPGARDIQADLDKALKRWGLTEAQLFEKTRELHGTRQIYNVKGRKNSDSGSAWDSGVTS